MSERDLGRHGAIGDGSPRGPHRAAGARAESGADGRGTSEERGAAPVPDGIGLPSRDDVVQAVAEFVDDLVDDGTGDPGAEPAGERSPDR